MGKSKAPPAPNYAPIIQAQTDASNLANTNSAAQLAIQQQQLGIQSDQLAWARDQYAQDEARTQPIVQNILDMAADQYGIQQADRARYAQVYQPLENDYINSIKRYTDPAEVEQRAGSAASDVSQQFSIGRANAQRQLEAYGIDPTQTRAAALDLGTRTQEAAARASAANISRRQDAQTADNMRLSALGIGQGYLGRAQQGAAFALQGDSAANSNMLATTASGANTMGTGVQYGGLGGTFGGLGGTFSGIGVNALNGASSSMNNQYQNQLDQYKANQASSSGIGGLLGTALGFGTKIAGLFADGGGVPGEGDDTAGIPVTRDMSPSRGIQTDDIPARLNAGEFVMPEDAVRWFGEKSLQRMISKSREERQGAQAKPRMQAVPDQRPAVDTTRGIAVSR